MNTTEINESNLMFSTIFTNKFEKKKESFNNDIDNINNMMKSINHTKFEKKEKISLTSLKEEEEEEVNDVNHGTNEIKVNDENAEKNIENIKIEKKRALRSKIKGIFCCKFPKKKKIPFTTENTSSSSSNVPPKKSWLKKLFFCHTKKNDTEIEENKIEKKTKVKKSIFSCFNNIFSKKEKNNPVSNSINSNKVKKNENKGSILDKIKNLFKRKNNNTITITAEDFKGLE